MEEGASPLERNLSAKILAFALSSLHGTASLIHAIARGVRAMRTLVECRARIAHHRACPRAQVHAPRGSCRLSRPTCPGPAVDDDNVCDVAIGAGPGGLAAALALQRQGLDVRVFEQREEFRLAGVPSSSGRTASTRSSRSTRRPPSASSTPVPSSIPSPSSSSSRAARKPRNWSGSTSPGGRVAWTSRRRSASPGRGSARPSRAATRHGPPGASRLACITTTTTTTE